MFKYVIVSIVRSHFQDVPHNLIVDRVRFPLHLLNIYERSLQC